MDNKENDFNFLLDEDFISWRLFPTKESNEHWEVFIKDYPHLEESLKKSIEKFNAIEINRDHLAIDDKKEIYRIILSNIHRYKRRKVLQKVSSIAAVLVIGVFLIFFVTREQEMGSANSVESEFIIGETLPEEEIYLISKGEKINIAHKSHIGLTTNGKALVTDSTDYSRELLLDAVELNRLVVPYGKRMDLTLSDGTKVWLNSGTQLDFPSEFMKTKREIIVNGEIFIEVAHNPVVPFVVRSNNISIRVLGTSFNISAYHDDASTIVVLVDGKIEVETAGSQKAYLQPNEKLEVIDNNIVKEVVNVSEYISWIRGILEFKDEPISEILKKIGRYYNVQFESSPDMEFHDKACSGKLFLSNNLDSVMTSVSALSSTIYQRDNNIIHIAKK